MARIRSTNARIARIPSKGTESRIKASSLMVGDEFVRTSENGKVISVVTSYNPRKKTTTTEINVRTPTGKTFERSYGNNDRVWIMEYPRTIKARRAMSRVRMEDRPTVVVAGRSNRRSGK